MSHWQEIILHYTVFIIMCHNGFVKLNNLYIFSNRIDIIGPCGIIQF